MQFRLIGAVSFSCAMAVLGSCGGDSGSTTAARLKGTVAAGLPLVGTVTIKDSSLPAIERTVAIGDAGDYRASIADMQAPLMLRAEGDVGATHYVIHSAMTTIAGATVNITPLTNLIVANVGGQSVDDYFAGGNFTSLTQAALDAESAALKAKLLPVLTAMGVDPNIDLLHTPFVPLDSPMDAALDVIQIDIDPDTQVATITNLVNQASITDNIATPASSEGNPPQLGGSGAAGAVVDIPKLRQVLADFIEFFEDDPDRAQVLALLTDDFLDNGKDRDGFFDIFDGNYTDEFGRDRAYDGDSFTDIVVKSIDYANNGGATPLAVVDFTLLDDDHVTVKGRVKDFHLLRGTDGKWRLHGNRSSVLVPTISTTLSVFSLQDVGSGCRSGGINFVVREPGTSNNAHIAFVNLVGPGLPAFQGASAGVGALWAVHPPQPRDWMITFHTDPANVSSWHPAMSWFPMTGSCTGSWAYTPVPDHSIAAFPDNMVYTMRGWATGAPPVAVSINASNSGAYGNGISESRTLTLPKRPLTLVELAGTTQFPDFTTSTAFATYSGGSITISGTVANPAEKVWVYLALRDSDGVVHSMDAEVNPSSGGSFSKTLSVANPGTITGREIRVSSKDVHGRQFMSNLNLQ